MTISLEAQRFSHQANQPYSAQIAGRKYATVQAKATLAKLETTTPSQLLLNALLKDKGYTPFKLMRALHIPCSTFYDLLSGHVRCPREKTFKKLFHFYLQVLAKEKA
jgi:predicted transcriptional regulator